MTGRGCQHRDALAIFAAGVSLIAGGRLVRTRQTPADQPDAQPALDTDNTS